MSFEALSPFFPYVAALMGLIFGSFANVVIYRWPQGLSVIKPRSACIQCKKQISAWDNIPVLSWILLKGQCRNCKAVISWRYPLVELIIGALFFAVSLKFGMTLRSLELFVFVWGLVTASFIDFDHFLLPDIITLPGLALGILGSLIVVDRSLMGAVAGAFMGGGFLWAIAALYYLYRKEEGLGGGDIKLLAWIGSVLEWRAIAFVILFSSLIGSVIGGALALRKNSQGLKTAIPFGPYLAAGAIVYIFWGEGLVQWYANFFISFE